MAIRSSNKVRSYSALSNTRNRAPISKNPLGIELSALFNFTQLSFSSLIYLVQPMLVNSLPIYWGNPLVDRDFNTNSFLNYFDFKNENELIEKIIEIDQNDDLYIDYMQQPYFIDNRVNHFIDPKNILRQFDYIFNTPKTPVAQIKKRKFFFL